MQVKGYTLNDWFLGLPKGRQEALRDDKWALANAFGEYICEQQNKEIKELREAFKGLINSFECECMEVHGHYFTAYLLDNDKLEAAQHLLNKQED